uniref:pulmonary surfactant-associated protein A-like isoform X1 n=1 Tax=Styela clava TaxID=7725 RepID=UPI00193A386F|nr:pulmonary surfactant-associated protein A-like isoform X1 [Styela clava]
MSMGIIGSLVLLCLLYLMAYDPVKADSKHLVCKTVEDIFDETNQEGLSSDTNPRRRGIPGKRGPQGVEGQPGSRGPKGKDGDPGIVNYERINATIEERVQAGIDQMADIIEERILEKVRRAQERECPGIRYQRKCYWSVIHTSIDVSYEQALQLCRKKSGYPADILNSQHYTMVSNYVRTNLPTSTNAVYLWIGMTYNPQTKVLKLSDGSKAPYVTWYPDYPTIDEDRTGMGFQVNRDENDVHQGMFNWHGNQWGVICEM